MLLKWLPLRHKESYGWAKEKNHSNGFLCVPETEKKKLNTINNGCTGALKLNLTQGAQEPYNTWEDLNFSRFFVALPG